MGWAADAEELLEESFRRWNEFVNGDGAPIKELFSRAQDLTLGNPFGPFVSGWAHVEPVLDRAAAIYSGGGAIDFEIVARHVGIELACFVYEERFEARVAGATERAAIALRVTTLFRKEAGGWRIVHWHGDPITQPRSAESVT